MVLSSEDREHKARKKSTDDYRNVQFHGQGEGNFIPWILRLHFY